METDFALDLQGRVERIVSVLGLSHVDQFRIICMRSRGSTANAYARIWNLPRIWQKALGVKTYYIIEAVSEHFDPLSPEEQDRVLIHELMHIPRTFSGALLPHSCFGKKIDRRAVEKVYAIYRERLESAGETD
jgi:predicted metallopeptidase